MDATPQSRSQDRLTRDAFARELERARPRLVCLAASVLNTQNGAEDVVQEAALVALDRLADFVPGTHFDAWIGRIVRFTALNHARARVRPRSVGEPSVELVDRSAPSGSLAHELDDDLTRALAALSETARAALLLRTVLELDYASIARLLEIPEGTAMSHVHRSREALRRALLAAREAGRRSRP
ncbi:MAG: RNA polymerase sigma factor [Planctomycetes bacterium]|nr:RNA polymerase sigma factor [Planctomycetota bacterium]